MLADRLIQFLPESIHLINVLKGLLSERSVAEINTEPNKTKEAMRINQSLESHTSNKPSVLNVLLVKDSFLLHIS
jgi:hypothetical protein